MPEDGISPKDWNVSSGNQTVCCYMYCLGGFPGGKQTKSRPGYFLRDGERIHQDFIFQDGPNAGKAKGLKVFFPSLITPPPPLPLLPSSMPSPLPLASPQLQPQTQPT